MTRVRMGTSAIVTIATLVLLVASPAWGNAKGKATSGSESVGSGSWGAAGSTTGGSPTIGTPFTLSWTVTILGVNPQYFKVVNTGTFDLSAETYTTTISGGPKIVLTACVGADWTQVLSGTCSGTQVSLGDSSSGATTASVSIPSGSYVSVRANATGVLSIGSYTTQVSVAVVRSQARAAHTTTS